MKQLTKESIRTNYWNKTYEDLMAGQVLLKNGKIQTVGGSLIRFHSDMYNFFRGGRGSELLRGLRKSK